MRFKSGGVMSKKKSDPDKKPKEAKASKTSRKAAGKSEKKTKPIREIPTAPPVPEPGPETGKPPVVPVVEKPKLQLPKKPAQIKRAAVAIPIEEISLRAYFIAERRNRMGWAGDETSDWVEAEKQLLSEAAKKQR